MSYDPMMLLDAYRRMRRSASSRNACAARCRPAPCRASCTCTAAEEAVAVGACMNLLDTDYIGSTHRGHGHCIAKGCDIGDMLLEIYCKQGGLCNGKGGSMHIADLEQGHARCQRHRRRAARRLAIGAALTQKTLKTAASRVAFIGDGASNQGTVPEIAELSAVLEAADDLHVREQRLLRVHGAGYHLGGADIAAPRGGASACRPRRWTAWTSSRCTTPSARGGAGAQRRGPERRRSVRDALVRALRGRHAEVPRIEGSRPSAQDVRSAGQVRGAGDPRFRHLPRSCARSTKRSPN